jgi:hypothetical protein
VIFFNAAKNNGLAQKTKILSFDQRESVMKSSKENKEERYWGRKAAFYLLKDLN